MPQHSAISTQIVARTIIWTFIFSAEIVIKAVIDNPYYQLNFDCVLISTAIIGLLLTLRLGKSDLARDFRDICFYDVLVQLFGWQMYEAGMSANPYFVLSGGIFVLKFARLLWPDKSTDGKTLVGWPVFGPFGYFHSRHADQHTLRNRPSKQQKLIVYAFMVSSFAAIFALREIGIKMHLAYWAAIALGLIALYFVRFIHHLDETQQKHDDTIKRLAATEAIAQKSQEIAAKNAELERKNTELAAAQREAEQARDEAERAKANEENISRALRDAAHNLAQNIALIGFAGNDIVRAKSLQERKKALRAYYDVSNKVTESIDQIMYYAKLTTKQAQPKIVAVEAIADLRRMALQWINIAFEKGVEVIKHYPRGEQRYIAVDAMLFSHLLQNLLTNAILHAGPECDRIVMSVRSRGDAYLLQVWDCGRGIAGMEGADGVANFAAFAQQVAEKAQHSGDGHGLGINIIQQLCEVAQIPVSLRSRVGHGTVFGVLIPKASPALIATTLADFAMHEKMRDDALALAGRRENSADAGSSAE